MKKIVQVLLIFLIIAGIIVISTAGFNVGLKYSEHTEISINVGSQFNVADIKAITKEVFGINDITRPFAENWIKWANGNMDKAVSVLEADEDIER